MDLINNLPDEMLINIFGFLKVEDLFEVDRVCSRWRNVTRFVSVWKDRDYALEIYQQKDQALKMFSKLLIVASALQELVMTCDQLQFLMKSKRLKKREQLSIEGKELTIKSLSVIECKPGCTLPDRDALNKFFATAIKGVKVICENVDYDTEWRNLSDCDTESECFTDGDDSDYELDEDDIHDLYSGYDADCYFCNKDCFNGYCPMHNPDGEDLWNLGSWCDYM